MTTWADTITLDTGATLQGELAQYEAGGDCQIKITEGELRQVIIIVPCYRVQSFMRTSQHLPVAVSHIPAVPAPPSVPQIPSFVTAETDADPAWPAPTVQPPPTPPSYTPKLSSVPETPFMPIADPITEAPPEEVPIEGGSSPQETWHPVHF